MESISGIDLISFLHYDRKRPKNPTAVLKNILQFDNMAIRKWQNVTFQMIFDDPSKEYYISWL